MKLCHMDKFALKIKEMKIGWNHRQQKNILFCHKVFFYGRKDVLDGCINPLKPDRR